MRPNGSCRFKTEILIRLSRSASLAFDRNVRMRVSVARTLRAIDVYSGVGGWSLGLRLAGIKVVASYELSSPANETNFKNNCHPVHTVDIRMLPLNELPSNIDIVVGSPPCTQFSFSNRGGGGNFDDGLKDIICFLRIVERLRPKLWAIENVPRVATIIMSELEKGGQLHKFSYLGIRSHIVSMDDYGLPQRRRRCIIGNFDCDLLRRYTKRAPARTLGRVVKALASTTVVDPIFGFKLAKFDLTDHVTEMPLNEEEIRINHAAKTAHVVYNSMSFPDRLDRPVRTITALCTRVSRESIIIEAQEETGGLRRLTIRERASLQGFPITFQFYADSYRQKLIMVGNALPPLFSWFMGHAFRGIQPSKIPSIRKRATMLSRAATLSPTSPPEGVGTRYSLSRRFRFAIPSLQLRSGVRFELTNHFDQDRVTWKVLFWFGTPQFIHSIELDNSLERGLLSKRGADVSQMVKEPLEELRVFIQKADILNMQLVWSHHGPGGTRPFMLLDALTKAGQRVKEALDGNAEDVQRSIDWAIRRQHGAASTELRGLRKLARNASVVLAGLLVGSAANSELRAHRKHMIDVRDGISKRLKLPVRVAADKRLA